MNNKNNKQMQSYLYEEHKDDDCLVKGICSISSTLSSIQEVVLLYIKELSFYLIRLKQFGITNDKIKEHIIYAIENIITDTEYNQQQFYELLSKLHTYIEESKILYESFCQKNELEIQIVKTYFKHSKGFNITEAIKKGEKYSIKKSQNLTEQQKNLLEIVLFLIKSICVKILELKRMEKTGEEAYYAMLKMLSLMNIGEFTEEKMITEINEFIQIYYEIIREVFYTQIELYGEITPTEVSFSTIPGKCILVSGCDLHKLEEVLKATQDTNINVYTHGLEMLMAHSFPKLRKYKHLIGHFGSSLSSAMLDFASFPGAILMTRATLQKVEYLYRGRLFTLDSLPAMGIIKIHNNDFGPLIKSALDAKGFLHKTQKPPMEVGFDIDKINITVDTIIDKIIKKEIKNLYFVGLLNAPNPPYRPYFEELFNLLNKDSFVFSLCCPIHNEKVFHLDSFVDYILFYRIIRRIKDRIPLNSINITVFLTRCDKHTISNLLYLKHIGIKNMYMCECPNSLLNPSLVKTLQATFDIKEISEVKHDYEQIMNNRNNKNE